MSLPMSGLQTSANYLTLPEGETNRHALIFGPPGTGKTTGIFIPNLIERVTCSALVPEAAGGKGISSYSQQLSATGQQTATG